MIAPTQDELTQAEAELIRAQADAEDAHRQLALLTASVEGKKEAYRDLLVRAHLAELDEATLARFTGVIPWPTPNLSDDPLFHHGYATLHGGLTGEYRWSTKGQRARRLLGVV
jgi:uncharacterized protein involved in exopolysaccharide biosynthesis